MGDLTGFYVFSFIFGIITSCILGAVTKSINESKGYDGGFAWGFWLGAIGIIVVACRPACTPVTPRTDFYNTTSGSNNSISRNGALPPNGWTCTCGKNHPAYETSCVCGKNKSMVMSERIAANRAYAEANAAQTSVAPQAPAVVPQPAVAPGAAAQPRPAVPAPTAVAEKSSPSVTEAERLQYLKEYKNLLDSGVISQEEFDAKKKQLLGL